MSDPVAVKHMLGNRTQIPDDAQPGHANQEVIGHVDFPPEKTLARGNGIVMMVVVPAFTERNQRQKCVVAAGVGRIISSGAVHVIQGVDRHGSVQQYRGGNKKPPDKHLHSVRTQLRCKTCEQ